MTQTSATAPDNNVAEPVVQAKVRSALLALMLGNVITGLAVLAPAGMLDELAGGLAVSPRETGLLVTFGAVVLCFGSPIMAWLTAAFDRRLLLAGTLLIVALGHLASGAANSYTMVLVLRLCLLAVVATYTPQAASTVALMVPPPKRSSAIAFVFLGWSLSIAAGLPIVTLVAHNFGWRTAYAGLGVAAGLACLAVFFAVPRSLRGPALALRSWAAIAGNRLIVCLLSITALWMAGYFVIFAYLGASLVRLAGAPPSVVAAFFAAMGAMGFGGNLAATRMIGPLGAFKTALVFLLALLFGAVAWAVGAGSLVLMGLGAVLLGLGFAAFNSVTQARLVMAAPSLAGASVALNTSCVYIGQAVGSGIAVLMFARGLLASTGYAATGFMLAAVAMLMLTRAAPSGWSKPAQSVAGE